MTDLENLKRIFEIPDEEVGYKKLDDTNYFVVQILKDRLLHLFQVFIFNKQGECIEIKVTRG